MKAVEKEKNDLEDVKNEAVEYLTMENDIVRKKNELYQKYMYVSLGIIHSFCLSIEEWMKQLERGGGVECSGQTQWRNIRL